MLLSHYFTNVLKKIKFVSEKKFMKYLLQYGFAIFGLLLMVSCTSDQDTNGDLLHNIWYKFDNRQLTKMETHLRDKVTGTFETESFTYSYIGSKLISYTDQDGSVTTLEYNADTNISKIVGEGTVSDFKYSGGNVSEIITTLEGVGTITSNYTFSGGKLTKVESTHNYSLPDPMKTFTVIEYQYAGDNVSKSVIKSGLYDASGTLVMNPAVQNISYTYDNKKSPYLLLPKAYVLQLSGLSPQGGAYLSVNNFETVTIGEGNSSKNLTFSHTYDKSGYPITSTADDQYINYSY